MRRQVMYDRIIGVTLYRSEKETGARYKTIAPDTFRAHVDSKGKKLITASNWGTYLSSHPLGVPASEGQQIVDARQVWSISFHEGDSWEKITSITNTYNEQGHSNYDYTYTYKTVRARGPRFTFNTLEDMQKGVRPDGSPFQTGDRIQITEDHTRWCVEVEGSSGSAYTEVVSRKVQANVLRIVPTDHGLKPDITLTISLLPGQNCYGATLKIRNFNMDAVDIRTWDKMIIEAGYRTGETVYFNCPIFSGYLESPNPDGIIVFEGLTVGIAEDSFTDKLLIVSFLQPEITLERIIRDVAAGISNSLDVNIALGKKYRQALVSVSQQKMYAQNGAALLNWLQTFVSEFLYAYSGGETTAFVQLVDNQLNVIAINGENDIPVIYDNIVNLDMVSGASFTGTALTVTAPWNPALKPGDLFFMPPQFINGARLPNNIPLTDYRNEANLYRALTMSVEFASVGPENKMTVLAVPAQWAGRLPEERTTDMPADVYGSILTEMYKDTRAQQNVPVGQANTSPTASTKAVQEKTGNDLIDNSSNIDAQWGGWTDITQSEMTGNCISLIARYYLYYMKGGPTLSEGMGTGKQRSYFKSKADLKDLPQALLHFQSTGISAQYLWWPLIVVGTYWKRYNDIKRGGSHNWTNIKLDNPNFLEAGKAVHVPNFPNSWEEGESRLKQIKDIWKWAYKTYKDLYGDSAKIWRAMYYYLGGTDELD